MEGTLKSHTRSEFIYAVFMSEGSAVQWGKSASDGVQIEVHGLIFRQLNKTPNGFTPGFILFKINSKQNTTGRPTTGCPTKHHQTFNFDPTHHLQSWTPTDCGWLLLLLINSDFALILLCFTHIFAHTFLHLTYISSVDFWFYVLFLSVCVCNLHVHVFLPVPLGQVMFASETWLSNNHLVKQKSNK